MQRWLFKISAIAILTNLAAYGQSLGDIARQYREKQQEQGTSGTPPKVFTNKDLPSDPEGYQGPREQEPATRAYSQPMARPFDDRGAERFGQERAAEQWRRAILEQQSRVANLQARIDQLSAAIHSRGGTAQYDGPFNRYQARQMQHLEQMQFQLEQQQRRLGEMQEQARRAGMHTNVYDP